jgi:putative ABC transport system substrate-binding protein
MIGKTISHYRILERIGEDDMGIVSAARQISKYCFFVRALAILLLVGIAGVGKTYSAEAEGADLAFKSIEKGEYCGHGERGDYVITNETDWKELWDRMHSTFSPKPPLPKIDFGKSMILAVFQGLRRSGGYSIEITKVIEGESVLKVFVRESHPPPGSSVTMALTQPYHIIETQKVSKKVIFEQVKPRWLKEFPPATSENGDIDQYAEKVRQRHCRIAIVKSSDIRLCNAPLEGFFEVMNERRIKCETITHSLKGRKDAVEELLEETRNFRPDVILTVGSPATGVISRNINDIPVVFSMVLYPVASGYVFSMERPGGNVTGAALDVPIEQQLSKLSEIVPDLRRVGVLYSTSTQPIIEEAIRVAESMNLNLLAEEVQSEADVPEALSRLRSEKIQLLWSVADERVFTTPSTRYIIQQTIRNKIPFMGPNVNSVKAGALLALEPDLRDNGRQAGELAIKILGGMSPKTMPVVTPRAVTLWVNPETARQIGFKFPRDIIDGAAVVFEERDAGS